MPSCQPPPSPAPANPLVMVKGAYDRAGGPETVLRMVVGHLDRARFPPTLALLARPGAALPGVLADLAERVPSERLPWRGLPGAPRAAARLAALLRDRPGAVLHTNDMRADLVAWGAARLLRRRVPWVAHVHGWLGPTHTPLYRAYERLDGWLVRSADLALVGSTAMAREVARAGARRVEVVTNGVPAADPDAHEAVAAAIRRDLLPDPARGFLVGALGRLHPGKGQALLLRAVAGLRARGRDAHALLVGEGPAEAEYRALAAELGLSGSAHFAGLVPDPLPWLRAADAVCVPSLKDSLPLTAFEAMSVARPVVASRAGDLPLAVEDGRTGLLVETGSSEALEAALARLAEDADLRARLGTAGMAAQRTRFTPQAMLRQMEGFCEGLLRERAEAEARSRRGATGAREARAAAHAH